MTAFFFLTCQPGAESLVKADMAARLPQAKLAFSRPGFLTFKREDIALTPAMERPTIFARTWGLSVGSFKAQADQEVPAKLTEQLEAWKITTIHGFVRDTTAIDERPADAPSVWEQDLALAKQLRQWLPKPLELNVEPEPDELILSVIEVDPGVYWMGVHQHQAPHRPSPGGRPPQRVAPQGAPSRVWNKIEEALWWSKLPYKAGDLVLDIGCSPGGGTLNLLDRGLHVMGVDPAEVAKVVLDNPRFAHIPLAFEHLELEASALKHIRWLVFDVNLSPVLTLKHLSKLVRTLSGLQGALITLKLNSPELLERLDWMFEHINRMDLEIVDITQLYYNRQEVCVYARRSTRAR